MTKKTEVIKQGIYVTIGSFAAMAISFMFYYLIFTLFEIVANRDASYVFVSPVRVGYGIIWIFLCLIIYRAKISDWLKASILAGSLTTFMAGIGVKLYETPIIVGLVLIMVSVIGVLLLHNMKKEWYHYYAIVISIMATLFYL